MGWRLAGEGPLGLWYVWTDTAVITTETTVLQEQSVAWNHAPSPRHTEGLRECICSLLSSFFQPDAEDSESHLRPRPHLQPAYQLWPVSLPEACGPDECSQPSVSGLLLSSSTVGHCFSPYIPKPISRTCSLLFRHLNTSIILPSFFFTRSLALLPLSFWNLFPAVRLGLWVVHRTSPTWHRQWGWHTVYKRGFWDQTE